MTSGPRTSSPAGCTRASRRPPIAVRKTSPSCCWCAEVGARTVRALAQVAEVVHGAPYRFGDPARFSLAHGGKDRHPFPVPLKVYDRTIQVMKAAVIKAKLGQTEELSAIRRLDEEARKLEAQARGPSIEALMSSERARSHEFGGRSVFGPEPAPEEDAGRTAEG